MSKEFDIESYFKKAGIEYKAPQYNARYDGQFVSNDTFYSEHPHIPRPPQFYVAPDNRVAQTSGFEEPDTSCFYSDTSLIKQGDPSIALTGFCMNEKIYIGIGFCKGDKFIRYDVPAWCDNAHFCHNETERSGIAYRQSYCSPEPFEFNPTEDLVKEISYEVGTSDASYTSVPSTLALIAVAFHVTQFLF